MIAVGSAGAPRVRVALREATLSSGVRVIVHENRQSPIVVVRVGLQASSSQDLPATAGLASLVGSGLIRGTTTRTFAEINATIDAAGMSLGASAGRHQTTVSARCLSEDLALALDLVTDLIRNPTFPDDEVGLLLGQARNGLRQADNDTGSVAQRHFRERCYPEGHPYRLRAHGYLHTVDAIGAPDLREFHAQKYSPAGAVIVVSGDVAFDQVVGALEARFGTWSGRSIAGGTVPGAPAPEPSRHDATLEGKTQADLILGVPCIARDHPDFYALRIANLVFGRLGMMGRLGETVREAMGLAYGISSDLDANVLAGPWSVRAGVNPKNVEAALDAIGTELTKLRVEGVTEEEFERACRFSIGSMALHLETNDGVAGTVSDMVAHALGLDYLDRYPLIIDALTLDEVNAAARTHIPAYDRVVVSIAGPTA